MALTFDLECMVEWLACPRLGIHIGLEELAATPSTSVVARRSSLTPASCEAMPSATFCLWCCSSVLCRARALGSTGGGLRMMSAAGCKYKRKIGGIKLILM